MAENKVAVEITLEEKAALKALTQLTKEVQKTETSFQKMGNQADESFSLVGEVTKGVGDGFGSLVKGVTIANLASEAIIGTANTIKNFVIDSVNAAIEAEQSNIRLAQSLRAVGAYSEENMAIFQAYANQLAQTTKYSDDEIISQIAIAKSMGATNKQAMNLVLAAAELSATFGGPLESRVQQLGKTLTGTGGKLDTLIPGFKALTEEQLKAGDAIDFVNKKFSGAAQNEIDTYAGKLAQLKKSYGELQEATGALVVESGVSKFFESLSGWVDHYTQSISDARIEEQRQQEGFTETSTSLDQLKRRYQELYEKANEAKLIIADPSWFDVLLGRGAGAAQNLKEITSEMAALQAQINSVTPQVQASVDSAPQGTSASADAGLSAEDQKRIDSYKTAQTTIDEIKAQSMVAQQEQDAILAAQAAGKNELEIQQIYEFEALKLEAQFSAEEEKANVIKDAQEKSLKLKEIGAKRELEFTKLANAQLKDENKKKVDDEKRTNDLILGATADVFAQSASLAKEGSVAQKALQITAATINSYVAFSNALADTRPAAAAPFVAASVLAVGLANVSRIAGAKFEQGGIVPGISTTGDKVPAYVNSGEMILNRQQQTQLFNMANGSGSGSGNVEQLLERLIAAIENQPNQLVVDGRVLATVIRKEVQGGFRLN